MSWEIHDCLRSGNGWMSATWGSAPINISTTDSLWYHIRWVPPPTEIHICSVCRCHTCQMYYLRGINLSYTYTAATTASFIQLDIENPLNKRWSHIWKGNMLSANSHDRCQVSNYDEKPISRFNNMTSRLGYPRQCYFRDHWEEGRRFLHDVRLVMSSCN